MRAKVEINVYYSVEETTSSTKDIERALYWAVNHLASEGLLGDDNSVVDTWSCKVEVIK